jgi:hypothetical protein
MTTIKDREARLDYIASLKPGWFDGEGKAVKAKDIAIARELLGSLPSIYPTPKGGISLEWVFDGGYLVMRIRNGKIKTYWTKKL